MTLLGPTRLSPLETLAGLLPTHLHQMIYLTIPVITMRNADIRYSTFLTGALRMDLVRYWLNELLSFDQDHESVCQDLTCNDPKEHLATSMTRL